jgi:hypothetical protein
MWVKRLLAPNPKEIPEAQYSVLTALDTTTIPLWLVMRLVLLGGLQVIFWILAIVEMITGGMITKKWVLCSSYLMFIFEQWWYSTARIPHGIVVCI